MDARGLAGAVVCVVFVLLLLLLLVLVLVVVLLLLPLLLLSSFAEPAEDDLESNVEWGRGLEGRIWRQLFSAGGNVDCCDCGEDCGFGCCACSDCCGCCCCVGCDCVDVEVDAVDVFAVLEFAPSGEVTSGEEDSESE